MQSNQVVASRIHIDSVTDDRSRFLFHQISYPELHALSMTSLQYVILYLDDEDLPLYIRQLGNQNQEE